MRQAFWLFFIFFIHYYPLQAQSGFNSDIAPTYANLLGTVFLPLNQTPLSLDTSNKTIREDTLPDWHELYMYVTSGDQKVKLLIGHFLAGEGVWSGTDIFSRDGRRYMLFCGSRLLVFDETANELHEIHSCLFEEKGELTRVQSSAITQTYYLVFSEHETEEVVEISVDDQGVLVRQ